MRTMLEKGRKLIGRGILQLGMRAQFPRGVSQQNLPISSARIRRAIQELCEVRPADRIAGACSRGPHHGRPFGYCVRARVVKGRVSAGAQEAGAVATTRFEVVHADRALLALLGKHAIGFDVAALRCAGLESLWRSDLARVIETRQPILARMTVQSGAEAIEIENFAFPVLHSGRIVEIRGWFDEADGGDMPEIDWSAVRYVRRRARSRQIALPRRLTRSARGQVAEDEYLSVLHAECPGTELR